MLQRRASSATKSRSPEQVPDTGPERPARSRFRLLRRVLLGLLATLLLLTGVSVGHALTMPGGGSVSERLAEWARDHYLGPVVTLGEWLTYKAPKVGGKPSFALTGPSAAVSGPASRGPGSAGSAAGAVSAAKARSALQHATMWLPPAQLASPAGVPLKGEGVWRVLGTVSGAPAIFGTYLRPDAVHTSYIAGIVSMNQQLLRFELRPGAEDPGPANWRAPATIPPGTRAGLLATFNSGFKISSSGGGFYLNGITAGTLEPGIASVVYYRSGEVRIGVWDSTVRMTPGVVGVRQNLHLIVQDGKVPASVDSNVETSWGATLGGGYYVWRSGIGITKDGRVIFVYGPALDVRDLAELLKRAGCVTAMQLDINPDWTSFMYYLPGTHPANPTPVNLLPDQLQPASRYYSLSSRDFTAVYGR